MEIEDVSVFCVNCGSASGSMVLEDEQVLHCIQQWIAPRLCLTIIPDRVILKYVNEKYISNASSTVRRSSKRGQYVFNFRLINKTVLGNNVSFHVTVHEHSSRYNQYVRTLMEFHYKWCDLVLNDIWFGPVIRKNGLTKCPTPPGPIVMTNMTFSGKFPFDVVFDKGKLEGTWNVMATGELMGSIDVFVSFKK